MGRPLAGHVITRLDVLDLVEYIPSATIYKSRSGNGAAPFTRVHVVISWEGKGDREYQQMRKEAIYFTFAAQHTQCLLSLNRFPWNFLLRFLFG